MSQRNDLSINWEISPRVITVASPSVEITMQDLLDTLRFMEAAAVAMDDASIVDAAGKEDLGGGTKVGLTVTLQNATLAFEARPGPEWVQCNVSGGNLVAQDTNEVTISPIEPTSFTQVVLANSSSATLQEQGALQYASFNGGVTIDVINGTIGTEYPAGTPQQPCLNIDDANTIADERGLKTFYIIGDLHLSSATPPLNDGHTFVGSGKDRTVITIDPVAIVDDSAYHDAEITGTLDGNSVLRDCLINNLIYVKGFIEQCVLSVGTTVLAGSEVAHFLDCWSGQPGVGTPIIDMGGSGQSLALRNYNGGIKLINKTGPESVSIDLNSGQVIIDNTVTSGDIILRGVGKWTNKETYTGGANVIDELVDGRDLTDIHAAHFNKRFWNKIDETITIYDTDGVTALYVFDTNADMSLIDPQAAVEPLTISMLGADGTPYDLPLILVDEDGTNYAITSTFLDADGTGYNI